MEIKGNKISFGNDWDNYNLGESRQVFEDYLAKNPKGKIYFDFSNRKQGFSLSGMVFLTEVIKYAKENKRQVLIKKACIQTNDWVKEIQEMNSRGSPVDVYDNIVTYNLANIVSSVYNKFFNSQDAKLGDVNSSNIKESNMKESAMKVQESKKGYPTIKKNPTVQSLKALNQLLYK